MDIQFARLLRGYGRGKRALALESEDLSLNTTNDITCVTLGKSINLPGTQYCNFQSQRVVVDDLNFSIYDPMGTSLGE